MNSKLKLISTVVISTFMVVSCNGGNNSNATNNNPLTPITGAHIEAFVIKDKIYEVKHYGVSDTNVMILKSVEFPRGSQRYYDQLTKGFSPTIYYYKDMASYKAARLELDQDYRAAKNNNKATGVTPQYNIGFPVGYNPTLSYFTSDSGGTTHIASCYNYNVAADSGGATLLNSLAITSATQNNASNLSDTLNISASYGVLGASIKGSNNLAYNTAYKGNYEDGNISFSNVLILPVSIVYSSLTDYGESQFDSGYSNFEQTCGTEIVTASNIGLDMQLNLSATSSDSSSTSKLADNLKVGGSDGGFSGSISNAFSESNSSSYSSASLSLVTQLNGDYIFQHNYTIQGIKVGPGTENLTASDAISSFNWSPNSCTQMNPQTVLTSSCNASISNLSSFIKDLFLDIKGDLAVSGLPQNLTSFAIYPNGFTTGSSASLGGSTTSMFAIDNENIKNSMEAAMIQELEQNHNDPYGPFASNLNQYTNLMWQIAQLSEAAQNMYVYLSNLNGSNSSPYNDASVGANLLTQLYNLSANYATDLAVIQNYIGPCLAESTNCPALALLPPNTTAYSFYANNYYNIQGFPENSLMLTADKAINSIFLTQSATYNETASLANPKNIWQNSYEPYNDGYYNGSATPMVNNSVPLFFFYTSQISSTTKPAPAAVIGSEGNPTPPTVSAGLYGIATAGLTMNNPYCVNGINCSTIEYDNGKGINYTNSGNPLYSGQATLPLTNFIYYIPATSSAIISLLNGSNPFALNSQPFTTPPIKLVNDAATVDSASVWPQIPMNQKPGYNGSPLLTVTATGMLPNDSITITAYGVSAGGNSESIPLLYLNHGANGVFGPIGTNQSLYAYLTVDQVPGELSSDWGANNTNISSLDPSWVLTLPSYWAQQTFTGGIDPNGGYCWANVAGWWVHCAGVGLYPYSDNLFTANTNSTTNNYAGNGYLWGAVTTQIQSTSNQITFTPILNFVPSNN